VPGEYFEARERALLGTRYDVLYTAPCAVRRGVTVNGLRCAPQEFAAAVDFGLEPSPFCDAAFLLTDPQLRPGRHAYHHAGVCARANVCWTCARRPAAKQASWPPLCAGRDCWWPMNMWRRGSAC